MSWLIKYQPEKLDDIKGQDAIIHRLKTKIKVGQISHYLFIGQAGVGKTATAKAFAKELFGDNWQMNFSSKNASDERGIDFVRDYVKGQTEIAPLEPATFRIVFLDEFDSMTAPAQFSLREVMMKNADTCKFILSCNYVERIISPIVDRCQVFRFRRLDEVILKLQIEKIAQGEGIPINHEQAMQIAVLSQGSMRKSLNALETLYGETKIDTTMIASLFGIMNPDYAKQLMKLAMSGNIEETEKYLYLLYYDHGFEVKEILLGMMDSVWHSDLSVEKKTELISLIGKYDRYLNDCGSQLVQIRCLLWDLRGVKL